MARGEDWQAGESSNRGMADLHTHLMPAVDDGARDPVEAAEAMRVLRDEGSALVVATPHLPASATRPGELARRMEDFDRAWERLLEVREAECPELRLERGVELRLDEPEPDLSDARLRLAGGDAVLVEFNRFQIPPYGDRQLGEIAAEGWLPVLAHPERYLEIGRRMEDAVPSWREAGAALLVNAGSLVGRHGPEARAAAAELLRRGWIDALASDYHARGEPAWSDAIQALEEAEAREQVELMTVTNPRRILEGQEPLPVPPVEPSSASLWTRVRRWLE